MKQILRAALVSSLFASSMALAQDVEMNMNVEVDENGMPSADIQMQGTDENGQVQGVNMRVRGGTTTTTSTSTSTTTTTTNPSPTTTTTTVSPTLCFNPDLQTPGPCSSRSRPRGSSNPGAAASTFNPSSLSPKLVSAVPACVGITVTFAISLLMSMAHCCMPRREKKDPDAVPGLPKTKFVPGEELEGKGDRK